MSHEELATKRIAQAERIWTLAAPDVRAEQLQTANFILVGNVSLNRLGEVAKLAEVERVKIVKLLKLASDAPLVKGCLILFVLKGSADYSQFVRAVEEREIPRDELGHALAKGSDLHASLVASTSGGDVLPALLAEQIAGGFLLSFGDVPPWFAAGAREPSPLA